MEAVLHARWSHTDHGAVAFSILQSLVCLPRIQSWLMIFNKMFLCKSSKSLGSTPSVDVYGFQWQCSDRCWFFYFWLAWLFTWYTQHVRWVGVGNVHVSWIRSMRHNTWPNDVEGTRQICGQNATEERRKVTEDQTAQVTNHVFIFLSHLIQGVAHIWHLGWSMRVLHHFCQLNVGVVHRLVPHQPDLQWQWTVAELQLLATSSFERITLTFPCATSFFRA